MQSFKQFINEAKEQNFVVKFYKDKNSSAPDNFERFPQKRLESVIAQLKKLLSYSIYNKDIINKKVTWIRIFKTPDHYHEEEPAIVDMNINDFLKKFQISF